MKLKTITISTIFLLSMLSIHAQQYKHCLDNGFVKWSLLDYHVIDAGLVSTELVAYGDTLINNLTYKKIHISYFDSQNIEESNTNWKNYTPTLFNLWKSLYIRESDDGSKLYVFNTKEDKEYLISDLNLQKGDKFQLFEPSVFEETTVDSVYVMDNLKHVRLNKMLYGSVPLTFIESIGPNIWYTYPYSQTGIVNCFQNQSIFYKSEFKDGDRSCPCGYMTPLTARTNEIIGNDYKLIVKGKTIEIISSLENETGVSIYDINGSLLYKNSFRQQTIDISTNFFAKGVYILKIDSQDGKRIITKKLIL